MPRSYHRFRRPTIPLHFTPGSDPRLTHIACHPNVLSPRLGATRRRIKIPCMMQSGKAASLRSPVVPTAGPQAARWRAANATLMHLDGTLAAGSRVCDVQGSPTTPFVPLRVDIGLTSCPASCLLAPAYLYMYVSDNDILTTYISAAIFPRQFCCCMAWVTPHMLSFGGSLSTLSACRCHHVCFHRSHRRR